MGKKKALNEKIKQIIREMTCTCPSPKCPLHPLKRAQR